MIWKSPMRRALAAAALIATLTAGPAATEASAQGLLGRIKRGVERAVTSEVEDKVEEEVRSTTRCALGDKRCIRAERKAQVAAKAAGSEAAAPGGPSTLIEPYPGSTLNTRDYEDYTEYNRIIGMNRSRRAEVQVLEGALTKLLYDNPKGRSTLELIRNYRSALEARGFQVDYEIANAREWILNVRDTNGMTVYGTDVRYFTGRLRYQEGTAYVSILVYREGNGFGRTNIHVLQTKEMDADMVGVDPSAMAAELDRTGEVNLKGVFFDTGRYTLRPESDAELDVVVALMVAQPQLTMQVVGHTDSTGSVSGNLTLSAQRANAVVDALIERGVDGSRLSAIGMGSNQPIASNATEAGRAQNRRVMLVRN
ncbi:OmpA family protein [Erythrobacter donghaensis]|uniref:OmpA family protein n=1 Tax=Erythrobacter donghaensis TaxID=267135 RepID=UPI000A3B0133|nr:OmpA family protein [Erythrobacter donghaensis]